KNGRIFYVEVSAANITYRNVPAYLVYLRDITDRKQREQEIKYISEQDDLTGLHNRRYLERKEAEIDTAENLPLSLIVGDINGLKLINDAFGLPEGDRVIKEAANIFKECCPETGILARTSGDEFCMYLPKIDNQAAMRYFNEIQTACALYNRTTETSFSLSISLGIETKTDIDIPLTQLKQNAENQMNQHKLLDKKSSHSTILSSIKAAMAAGVKAACKVPGVKKITAGNYGGSLGPFKFQLHDLF
ncbi:diguanylate cyclase, partial [Candidatus Nomurabacteria bacterium]|nr:diguanylate cyclase [Candidatus Nomurabacteria bacterium]